LAFRRPDDPWARFATERRSIKGSGRGGGNRWFFQLVPSLSGTILDSDCCSIVFYFRPRPNVGDISIQIEADDEVEVAFDVSLVAGSVTRAARKLDKR